MFISEVLSGYCEDCKELMRVFILCFLGDLKYNLKQYSAGSKEIGEIACRKRRFLLDFWEPKFPPFRL